MATMWMGVLALEPVAGALPQRQMLTRATAQGLNDAMGAQLARFHFVDALGYYFVKCRLALT